MLKINLLHHYQHDLLHKLLEDTLGNGYDLQGSTILKRRLLEGLCQHYLIDSARINEEVDKMIRDLRFAYGGEMYGTPVIDRGEVRDHVMEIEIQRKSGWQPARRQRYA